MKALERYVKKSGKTPYGSTESKGSLKGSEGPQMSDQYADGEGTKVVDDARDYDEDDPKMAGKSAVASIKSGGKKKQRSYLKD